MRFLMKYYMITVTAQLKCKKLGTVTTIRSTSYESFRHYFKLEPYYDHINANLKNKSPTDEIINIAITFMRDVSLNEYMRNI